MLLKKSQLQIVGVASDDPTRFVLNGIHVIDDGKTCRLQATDGKICLESEFTPLAEADFPPFPDAPPEDSKIKSGVIRSETVQAILKVIPKKSRLPGLNTARVYFTKSNQGMALTNDLENSSIMPFNLIDGIFPTIEHTIPKKSAVKLSVALGLPVLKKLILTLEKMEVTYLELGFIDDKAPILVTADAPDQTVRGAFMPCRKK